MYALVLEVYNPQLETDLALGSLISMLSVDILRLEYL